MKTYKVSYFVDEETKEKDVLADRVGITPDGHLVFEAVQDEGTTSEKSQFIAAFASGYWLTFEEKGIVAYVDAQTAVAAKKDVIREAIEIQEAAIEKEAIE